MISPRINIVLLGKIISVRTIPSSHGNLGVKKRREKEKERRKERKQQYLLTCFGGELIRPRHAWCAADAACTLLSHIFCERRKSQKEFNKRWREKQMRSTEGWLQKKVGTCCRAQSPSFQVHSHIASVRIRRGIMPHHHTRTPRKTMLSGLFRGGKRIPLPQKTDSPLTRNQEHRYSSRFLCLYFFQFLFKSITDQHCRRARKNHRHYACLRRPIDHQRALHRKLRPPPRHPNRLGPRHVHYRPIRH